MTAPFHNDQRDEIEQLRTALESAQDEVTALAADRDRLLQRVTAQAREVQAANEAYRRATATFQAHADQHPEQVLSDQTDEELRVAFEEMQVLTEELEAANAGLHESNRLLDERVAQRTRDLAETEQALRASEQRLQMLLDGIPQFVWRAVKAGEWTWSSPQWTAFTGLSVTDSQGMGWLAALHPDDRQAAMEAWQGATAAGRLSIEFRVRRTSTGAFCWFQTRAMPVRSADGSIAEWLGTSTDIDELRRLKDRQQVLVAELQHRVRNILTVIRGVVARTARSAESVDGLAQHLQGRLDSLARTQVIVTRSANGYVDLEQLLRDELLSVGASDGPNLVLEGAEVALPAKAAELVGLAVHELATNALKYGALKHQGARLHVSWTTNLNHRGKPQLVLIWSEQGVPAVAVQPSRQGFGTELIKEALPYRLGAETELSFKGGGVCCSIRVPLLMEDMHHAVARGAEYGRELGR